MDFNATVDLIIRELEEAREIIDDLKKYPGAPVLQIELAKSKCRNAAEVIALLKQMKEFRKEQQEENEDPAKKKSVPEPPAEPVQRSRQPKIDRIIEIEAERNQAIEETKPEHNDIPDHKEPAVDENAIAEQKPAKPYVAPIIADTFSHLANRFNEQLGENQPEDFSYTHGKHYQTLSGAIGVNDRFYFIREIFDGNREKYNEAITKLDTAKDINEAKQIIAEYKTDKSSSEALRQLLDLAKRKFGTHE